MTRPYDNLLSTQSAESQSFVWGNSLLSASGKNAQDNFHYLQDHLGSPIRLANGDNLSQPISYDEFGVPEVTAGVSQPFGFTGYQSDNIGELWYAQARYYEPKLGRFGAVDSYWNPLNMVYGENEHTVPNNLAIMQSNNLYSYTASNPMRYVDSMGACIDEDSSSAGGLDVEAWMTALREKATWGLGGAKAGNIKPGVGNVVGFLGGVVAGTLASAATEITIGDYSIRDHARNWTSDVWERATQCTWSEGLTFQESMAEHHRRLRYGNPYGIAS